MMIYAEVDNIRGWIAGGDWDGLEAQSLGRCRLADPEAAEAPR